ncbi:MAG: RagB/SusD family nutrient uptake outer membrane protein [Bacteroidaceae bacterium]|nr:RagB/SusD family nutrient uptake outer membrane protein [Bacteroidaceae bacterium]
MVYRKSLIWLRFAEALNRAGYPGYAFAILKNGLTRNSEWVPSSESDFAVKTMRVHYEHTGTKFDEAGNIVFGEDNKPEQVTIVLPEDWETNQMCVIRSKDFSEEGFLADSTAFAEYIIANAQSHFDTIADYNDGIRTQIVEYANFTPDNSHIICDYISRDEWERSQGILWLDFNKGQFEGKTYTIVSWIHDYPVLETTTPSTSTYPFASTENEYYTRGIHQKGCGMLKPNEKKSVYNYVDQINLKLEAAGKPKMTKAEIYDRNNIEDVKEAIEDLILDEAGLELAFEGNRFFDLMRVANRRSNPEQFMVNKIKARGQNAEAWADQLNDKKNWFLPLPDFSNKR